MKRTNTYLIIFSLIGFLILSVAGCSIADNPSDEVELPTLMQFPDSTTTPTITPSPGAILENSEVMSTSTQFPASTPSPAVIATLTLAPTLTQPVSENPPANLQQAQLFDVIASQIDRELMMETISTMQNFKTRHVNAVTGTTETGIDAARAYLLSRLQEQATRCASPMNILQDTYYVDFREQGHYQMNLIAGVQGNGETAGTEAILIGAHYDTMSRLDRENAFAYQPGANDNGSGVAANLELLRLMCLTPHRQTMLFVFFAAEEAGRKGSKHFVNEYLPVLPWRIITMMNLDTIGSSSDEFGGIQGDAAKLYPGNLQKDEPFAPSRQMARYIKAAAYLQMPDYQLWIQDTEDREDRYGDHISFSRQQYPAVRLLEGSEDYSRQDTPQDTINDIDPAYLEKNLKVAMAFLLGLSEGLSPPSDIQINGNTVTWEAVPGATGYILIQRWWDKTDVHEITIINGLTTVLPSGTVFSISSIGENGIAGFLSDEYTVP